MPQQATAFRVQAYPPVRTQAALCDFLARAAWHFAHVPQLQMFVPLAPGVTVPKEPRIPEGFAPQVQDALDAYRPRVQIQTGVGPEAGRSLLTQADVVLALKEDDKAVNTDIAAAGKTTYRVDPIKVRQEGSYFIQCAFDHCTDKPALIEDSRRKFEALRQRVGQREKTWVLATGPSVENYREHDFGNATVIVCNSVVLNDDLMHHCNPAVLVFADPIFHFGVSEYAGRFRELVEQRLRTTDLTVVVPFKYYPLLLAKWPQYAARIIGVPFEKFPFHNHDLKDRFVVKTTANILTLLLLPLATTFGKQVHILGCDGRPLDQDDYFWGHGKSVQINEKMENIQRVHPGFFAIDYNEYYFEHCHTLANQLEEAESAGWRFAHHAPSYIPALRDRPAEWLALPLTEARARLSQRRRQPSQACLVIEPDGIGLGGHYVRWHRNLVSALGTHFEQVGLLCSLRQDPSLYGVPTRPTFTIASWTVSRSEFSYKRDFTRFPQFTRFVEELVSGIRAMHDPLPPSLTLYVYYGSVQILKAVQLARKQLLSMGTDLRACVCLFHESVVLAGDQRTPRFPPNATSILQESAVLADHYRIASVTPRLRSIVRETLGIGTDLLPNPVPDRSDAQSEADLRASIAARRSRPSTDVVQVVLPTIPREEKGAWIIRELLEHFAKHGVPGGQRYCVRGLPPENYPVVPGLEFIGDDVPEDRYRSVLLEADAVVIPYTAPGFSFRTSGVLVDALIGCAAAVVLRGTWLADIVEATGTGLVIDYNSPMSITSAAKVLGANRQLMLARVARGAEAYLAEHTWRRAAALAVI